MIIFGGTGFLGKHLLMRLAEKGDSGFVVSRNPDLAFLSKFAPSFEAMDLHTFCKQHKQAVQKHDTIIYMASGSVPATFANTPWKELSTNVEPMFKLMHDCLEHETTVRLVFISSGGTVYGGEHKEPVRESAPCAPISPYGYGKLASEEAIRFLGRTRGLHYAILRVSNPIGRFQLRHDQGIVGAALNAATTGATMRIFGHGRPVRDFIDADDVAHAIELAASRREFEQVTWNVGSGHGRSILEMVEYVEFATGVSIDRQLLPHRPGDVDYSVLNCERIFQDIGWKAKRESPLIGIEKAAAAMKVRVSH